MSCLYRAFLLADRDGAPLAASVDLILYVLNNYPTQPESKQICDLLASSLFPDGTPPGFWRQRTPYDMLQFLYHEGLVHTVNVEV